MIGTHMEKHDPHMDECTWRNLISSLRRERRSAWKRTTWGVTTSTCPAGDLVQRRGRLQPERREASLKEGGRLEIH